LAHPFAQITAAHYNRPMNPDDDAREIFVVLRKVMLVALLVGLSMGVVGYLMFAASYHL
jgi:hypothetical protein